MICVCPSCFGIRHFNAVAASLARAGRARGLVVDCLSLGNRDEAQALCRTHYDAVKKGGLSADGPAAAKNDPRTALERFAKEFGLKLPSAEEGSRSAGLAGN